MIALVLVFIATTSAEEIVRPRLEHALNAALKGYRVRLPEVRLHIFDLSISLLDLQIRQEAHPDPPVALIPRLHAGVDIAVPAGTPIRAADSGTVVLLGVVSGYGNYTCIQHDSALSTCYAHQSSFATSNGANVSKGQVIGYVGCTGHCYGDHLHFETRVGGSPVDPFGYL